MKKVPYEVLNYAITVAIQAWNEVDQQNKKLRKINQIL